jgi:hypothetical protein
MAAMTAPARPPVKAAPPDEAKPEKESVYYSMTKAEGRTLFHQMEERRGYKECFGV